MLADDRFRDLLGLQLPKDETFELYHARSSPTKSMHLVFTSVKDKSYDVVTHHYFLLAHDNMLVLVLELYLYQSRKHCTLFVSKADTSGHYHGPGLLNIMSIVQALLRGTLRYYVPAGKPVRISLFAKAEPQYLLIGSAKNPKKHVLSDSDLVKWWVRCLDGLADDFKGAPWATLQIPGVSPESVKRYVFAGAVLPWSAGDIYRPDDPNTWAIRCIPRFPDDPKHRFLDFIVAEKRAKQVNAERFWTELESRQEFRLGTSVGILGIQGVLAKHENLEGSHAVPNKTMKIIEAALIESDFSTIDSARYSTGQILKRIPAQAECEVVGEKPIVAERLKRTIVEAAPVNMLQASSIRKKSRPS